MLSAKFYKLLQTVTKIKINEFSIVCSNHQMEYQKKKTMTMRNILISVCFSIFLSLISSNHKKLFPLCGAT